jgi:hypothetical protein
MSRYLVAVFVAIILLTAFAPTPAKADSIDTFVFTTCEDTSGGGCGPGSSLTANTYSWQAPSSPTPTLTNFASGCYQFAVQHCFSISAIVTANGTNLGPEAIFFGWGEPLYGGGFEIVNPNCPLPSATACFPTAYGAGPAVWSGAPAGPAGVSPTFIPGTYTMFLSDSPSPNAGTLTITSATGVPEPSTLLLTGAGLLLALAVIAFWRKESATTTCS